MTQTTQYFIRGVANYDKADDAYVAMDVLKKGVNNAEFIRTSYVGYFMTQPIYKSWVPRWLIGLITL